MVIETVKVRSSYCPKTKVHPDTNYSLLDD